MGKEGIILFLLFLVFSGITPIHSLPSNPPHLVGAYVSPDSGEIKLINQTHLIIFSVPRFTPYSVCVDYQEKTAVVGGSYIGFPAAMTIKYSVFPRDVKLIYLEKMKGRLYDVKCDGGGFLGGGYVEYGGMYRPLIINITSAGAVTEIIDLASHSYIRELTPNSREILAVGGMYYLGSYRPVVIYHNASYTLFMLEGLSLTKPVVRGIIESLPYLLILDDKDLFLVPLEGGDVYRLSGVGGVKGVDKVSLLNLDLFIVTGENGPSWVLDSDLRCHVFQSRGFVAGFSIDDESIYAVSSDGGLKIPLLIKGCDIVKVPQLSAEIVNGAVRGLQRVETALRIEEIYVNFTATPLSGNSWDNITSPTTSTTPNHNGFFLDTQAWELDYTLLITGIILLFLGIFFHFNFKEK